MSHRTPIEVLKLAGSPNLARAMKRPPKQQVKRAELEAMFADIQVRLAEAKADVKKNGSIIFQDKSNARGMVYQVRVINPAMKIAQQCERQMASLIKQLNAMAEEQVASNVVGDDFNDIFAKYEVHNVPS